MAAEHDFNWPSGNREADAAMAATLDILKALVLRNGFGNIAQELAGPSRWYSMKGIHWLYASALGR